MAWFVAQRIGFGIVVLWIISLVVIVIFFLFFAKNVEH